MSNEIKAQSPSNPTGLEGNWTGTQAYILATFCLLLGVALGYLFRGSASPSVPARAAAQQGTESRLQPGSDVAAAMAQTAAPLLDAIDRNPNDYDSLVKLGNVFYDGQQYPRAILYYERALVIHPENPDVRTDMGTAYWYMGNSGKAVAAMETSLKYRPGHPQTLFNLGWVRWQGKADAKGAVAAWEQLLKANPDYPQKQQVEQYIAKAKEHAARG
jgi:cytochrome c-type biogenesis protein CcmH/NrfG